MKITGTSTLDAPVEQVWAAILDPAVLAVCIPGCSSNRKRVSSRRRGRSSTGRLTVKSISPASSAARRA